MYAIYPSKNMRISQRYDEGNHITHMHNANYVDYPIDETYGDSSSNGIFYAPFDCEVVKKYSATTKEIWITSSEKVITPIGYDYVTIYIAHIRSNEYDNIKVGDKFKQYEKIVSEEKDSMSTGYHNHISCGLGKIKGTGWVKNNRNVWVLRTTNGTKRPEQIFYIDENHTKITDSRKLKFETMPKNVDSSNNSDDSYITYTIKKGDTLSEIAKEYNTSVSELAKINDIEDVDLIYAGRTLKIPKNKEESYITYKIKKGDNLTKIAKKYNTTIKILAKLNNIKDVDKIYAGKTLKIPKS